MNLGETCHLKRHDLVTMWRTMLLLCCYHCDCMQQHYDVMQFECVLWRHTMHEWVMNIHYKTWIAQGRFTNIILTPSKQWGMCDKRNNPTSPPPVPSHAHGLLLPLALLASTSQPRETTHVDGVHGTEKKSGKVINPCCSEYLQETSKYDVYCQISNLSPTFCRQLNCWSLRCSWSNAYWRCSNYVFMLDLTPGFNGLGKDNCKTRREAIKFSDLVQLILEVWWHFFIFQHWDGTSSWNPSPRRTRTQFILCSEFHGC